MHHRINWGLMIRIGISAALLIWLACSIDWHTMGQVLSRVQLGWMVAAVCTVILSMIISVWKWRVVLEAQHLHLPWQELWKAYWAGLFFNNFLPSSIGGDAVRIVWIGRVAQDPAGAAASVVVERILATVGLSLTGLTACLLAARPEKPVVALFVAALLASLILLSLALWGRVPKWAAEKTGAVFSFIRGMISHGARLGDNKSLLLAALGYSILFQVSVVAVNYAVFQALQIYGLGWRNILYVIPVTSIAAMLPVGINGYGVREGAYVSLLAGYQVGAESALAASLLFAWLVSLCSLYGGMVWFTGQSKGENSYASGERLSGGDTKHEIG